MEYKNTYRIITVTAIVILCLISAYTEIRATTFEYSCLRFKAEQTKGGMQNWEFDIDTIGNLYVANEQGLLVFDGNNWELFKMLPHQPIRTVRIVGARIFTAGDKNAGFWSRTPNGELTYTSIISPNASHQIFWSIVPDKDVIYLQSFKGIWIYDGKSFQQIKRNGGHRLFEVDRKPHILSNDKINIIRSNGNLIPTTDDLGLNPNCQIRYIGKLSSKKYIYYFLTGEAFIKENGKPAEEINSVTQITKGKLIDCALLTDKHFFVGTIGYGIYVFDREFRFVTQLNTDNGLNDNIVHRMFFFDNTLWASHDNGITSIKQKPLFSEISTPENFGYMTSCIQSDTSLFIGTNHGLFKTSHHSRALKKCTEIKGKSLSLAKLKGTLFCSTHDYCYTYDGKNWNTIPNVNGLYDFVYTADKNGEYLVSPAINGIHYFKFDGQKWISSGFLKNYNHTCERLIAKTPQTLWAFSIHNGIFRLTVNEDTHTVIHAEHFNNVGGEMDISNIFPHSIDGEILFFTPDGVFTFNNETHKFVTYDVNNDDLGMLKSGKFQAVNDHLFWTTRDNEIKLHRLKDNEIRTVDHFHLPMHNICKNRSGNFIFPIAPDLYIIALENGATILNMKNSNNHPQLPPRITSIKYIVNDSTHTVCPKDNRIEIPYNAYNIRIKTSMSIVSQQNLLRLKHNGQQWTQWQTDGIFSIMNLSSGKHHVTIENYKNPSLAELTIVVTPPFYLSASAIILYVLFLVALSVMFTHILHKKRKEKALAAIHEELRRSKEEIMQFRNEQLQAVVENQKKQINEKLRMVSQKQEILIALNSELEKQRKKMHNFPDEFYRNFRELIENGMNNESEFQLFQNYYQEINHDFMIELKKRYSFLSPSELLFCCLHRANLSTKNIALILNITIGGVEMKRYRLKKKLNYSTNLYDFVQSF